MKKLALIFALALATTPAFARAGDMEVTMGRNSHWTQCRMHGGGYGYRHVYRGGGYGYGYNGYNAITL